MKMHSTKMNDPLISLARPVTLMIPLIDEILRIAGVQPDRNQLLDRFMSGQPRIAVIHGSEDHPPSFGGRETVRRLIRQIWAHGGLPFDVSQSMPCEQLCFGHEGMHYTLVSRNCCAANLAAQIEAHGYDAAIVLGVCDKMTVGNLRALIEADQAHQRRRARPLFAAFIPPFLHREALLPEDDRMKFEPLRLRLNEFERAELDNLIHRPLKPFLYADLRLFLDRCSQKRLLSDTDKDELSRISARATAVPGANCAASESALISRMVLAALGFVPRRLDLSARSPSEEQLGHVVERVLLATQKRERRVSISNLVKMNLHNAAAVWGATGGHPSWLLHLAYLADAIGQKLTASDVPKNAKGVPQVLSVDEVGRRSVYAIAAEADAGANSGIDTIMRTLAEKRLIDDRAPTIDGPWTQRITDARSANGNFFSSTMIPFSASCGIVELRGNVCRSAFARVNCHTASTGAFDKKIYLTVYYLSQRDLPSDLGSADTVLERLKKKVTREDLYNTWQINWRPDDRIKGMVTDWNKIQLWDFLIRERQLRAMVIVAGEGPRASGMPEVQQVGTLFRHDPQLRSTSILMTDGRVPYLYDGISIAHVVPETLDGAGLAAVRTGDWIHLDLPRGFLNVVVHASNRDGYSVIPQKQLLSRPEVGKRIHELLRLRETLVPSFRALLDGVSAADTGVSPAR